MTLHDDQHEALVDRDPGWQAMRRETDLERTPIWSLRRGEILLGGAGGVTLYRSRRAEHEPG